MFSDRLADQGERLLHRLLTPFRGHVDRNLWSLDLPNQRRNRATGNSSKHLEDRKFEGRQRQPERQSVEPKVEVVDVDPLENQIEFPRILAQKEWPDVAQKDRKEPIHRAVGDRDALCAIL